MLAKREYSNMKTKALWFTDNCDDVITICGILEVLHYTEMSCYHSSVMTDSSNLGSTSRIFRNSAKCVLFLRRN